MAAISLNDLINEVIYVEIQYIDTDKSTVLNQKNFFGRILKVDPAEGITIQPEEDGGAVAVIPPSAEACWRDEKNVLHVNWLVYRRQEVRVDGEHEWWDWQPKRK